MKYKVGDKVRVKSREWYEVNKDCWGGIECGNETFSVDMACYCGKTLIVMDVDECSYSLGNEWYWTDEMLEDVPVEDTLFIGIKTNPDDNILSEALTILNGDRQADYGDAVENFKNIAKCASDWCGKELTALDCVNVMIAVKTKREQFKHKRDNLVDLAAYMEIRRQIIENNGN